MFDSTTRSCGARLLSLAAVLVLSVSTAFSAVPGDMVAHYCFDNPSNLGKDCSTYGNNGTTSGGVTAVAGVVGGGAKFGGVANPGVILVPNSSSLTLGPTMSLSYFLKIDNSTGMNGYGNTVASDGAHAVVAKSHDRTGMVWLVYATAKNELSTGPASYGIKWTAGTDVLNGWASGILGRWVHVVSVIDSVGSKTYMDGRLAASVSGSVNFGVTNTRPLYIGKYSDYWYPLNGTLDDLRIYNRALSLAEVQSLYGMSVTTVPGAPTGVTVVAGNTQATVSFVAPSSVGITGYTVTALPGNIVATGSGSPITVTGLTNGTSYTFTVKASNAAGVGAESVASTPVTPAGLTATITVGHTGTGAGVIYSTPPKILCRADTCAADFAAGTAVNLQATPQPGSVFTGWSGGCTGVKNPCELIVSTALSITANFALLGACDASSVSTITPNGYAFINGHQAFEVTCQNGRFGGVRLPRGSNRTEMQVCAFQQSSCGNAANVCMGTTPASSDLESVYLKRNDPPTTLLIDPIIQPLAAWVCQ